MKEQIELLAKKYEYRAKDSELLLKSLIEDNPLDITQQHSLRSSISWWRSFSKELREILDKAN